MASIKVNKNKLPQLPQIINDLMADAITKAAGDIVAHADPNTPVDTGHLKNDKEIEVDGLSGKVHWKSDYALYVHEGTRYRPSQPFAADAAEKVAPSLAQALDGLEGKV
jgi:HK97 gp10 family phage protein